MRTLQLTTYRRSFFEEQIAALRSRGIECTVLEVPGEYTADDPRTLTEYLQYYPEVLEHGLDSYDLVHANHGLTAPFALAQPTRPVVTTFWGSELMSQRGWQTKLSRASARLSDRVILPSERMGEFLDSPYTHIPFPVDTDVFEPIERATAKAYVGWEADSADILFPYDPSRPEKDFERAAGIVEAANIDAELRTVSGKAYAEMPYYLNASDAVLVTSKRESGPMIVREAAACNVPIVSTDVGFVRETLDGIEQCAVCESDLQLAGALEVILSNEWRPNGRDTIETLHPERFGRELETLYASALDRREVPA
ncbi:glycosyltransferase family 4 protein [Halorientalis salina]|uniref:glycosyltransferase family 4 protein n=1 Tax=Halorientalis salina TaxID=2932266 RepID=UPI0010AB567C|nr:glycosyltransferase family 4 protein [Halorientalis salina]